MVTISPVCSQPSASITAASSNKAPKVFFAYQSCMACLPVLWLPGPVAACDATAPRGVSRDGAPHTHDESPGPQACLASTACLHPSGAGAHGGRGGPGTAATPFPWTTLP